VDEIPHHELYAVSVFQWTKTAPNNFTIQIIIGQEKNTNVATVALIKVC